MLRHNRAILTAISQSGYYPEIPIIEEAPTAPVIIIDGEKYLNFSSNSYLNLSTHPRVISAVKQAIEKFGVGAGGSRITSGTTTAHIQLEEKIAQFKDTEAAVVLPTGYQTNLSLLGSLINPRLASLVHILCPDISNDFLKPRILIVIDKLSHASIVDGTDLCKWPPLKQEEDRVGLRYYNHLDMDDLERKISQPDYDIKIIITDGVFSLHGHIAPLDKITAIANKYGAFVYVDDAHGTGVLGENGKGTSELFGVQNKIDFNMGTLSKAIGSQGGFIAGREELCKYIKTGRPNIFSTAMTPAIAIACVEAINVIEEEPEIRTRLSVNSDFVRTEATNMEIDTCGSQTQIIPIMVGTVRNAKLVARALQEDRILGQAYYYPAVPKDKSIIRVNIMAGHSKEHLERFLESIERILDSLL